MIGALLNIPGRVQLLLTRLTAARGANLDNLNAPLSLVAPASTALSTAVWTQAHADAIMTGGTGSRSKALEYTAQGAFAFVVPANVTMVFVTLQGPGGAGGHNTTNGAGGGGSGELIRRQPYKVTPGATVNGSIGAGTNSTTGQNTTFGTLVARPGAGGSTVNSGGRGGGGLGGGSGAQGTAVGGVLGGGGGGNVGAAGAACGQYPGGAGVASGGGGGAASYFAPGGAAQLSTLPAKPGIGAGAGGTKFNGNAFGGDGYVLIEWIG